MAGLQLPFYAYLPFCCCNEAPEKDDKEITPERRLSRWIGGKSNREPTLKIKNNVGYEMASLAPRKQSQVSQQTGDEPERRDGTVKLERIRNHDLEDQYEWRDSFDCTSPKEEKVHKADEPSTARATSDRYSNFFSVMETMKKEHDVDESKKRLKLCRSLPFVELSSLSVLNPRRASSKVEAIKTAVKGENTASKKNSVAFPTPCVDSDSVPIVQDPAPVIVKDQISTKSRHKLRLPDFFTFIAQGSMRDERSLSCTEADTYSSDDDVKAWLNASMYEASIAPSILAAPKKDQKVILQPPTQSRPNAAFDHDTEGSQAENTRPALTQPMQYTSQPESAKAPLAICTWHASNGRAYVQHLQALEQPEMIAPKNAWLDRMMAQLGLDGETDCLGLLADRDIHGLPQRREQGRSAPW